MKAVILAGGSGTRGKPYTEFVPKAMMPVRGRPIIGHIARFLQRSDMIDGIIVLADLEGLGGQIRNYLQGSGVSFVQDAGAGTGGDLVRLLPSLRGESEFLLWFVDNLCRIDIDAMLGRFRDRRSRACIATRSRRREETGFATVDADGIVSKFIEKPNVRLQTPQCLGIYIISTRVLRDIKKSGASQANLSYDVLEDLAREGLVSAFDIGRSDWIDADSPVTLERNGRLVGRIIRQMER